MFPAAPTNDLRFVGTPATTAQMAKDVTTFLSWAAEPEHDERKKMGLKAVILTGSMFLISIWLKRFKWAPIKNRKLGKLLFPLYWLPGRSNFYCSFRAVC